MAVATPSADAAGESRPDEGLFGPGSVTWRAAQEPRTTGLPGRLLYQPAVRMIFRGADQVS